MNQPRPRGRAGALAIVALTAILTSLVLLQGSSIKTAYARPLSLIDAVERAAAGKRPPAGTSVPAWAVMPPRAGAAMVPPGRSPVKVPILMYHYIRTPPDPGQDRLGWGLSTSPDDFRRQMDFLDQNGFHPVTLGDLRDYLDGARSLPARPVVLTFDDGYEDFYTTAFPVLKQHHFRAVAYIVSGFMGRGTNLSPDQIREIDAYGIEIGAHTVNHVDLTNSSAAGLKYEVKGSKDSLEAIVGHPVLDFCYPSGRFNDTVIQAVQAAGFASATTTQPGAVHSLADRYTWSRVRVFGSESLDVFAQGLAQFEEGIPPALISPILIPRVYPLVFLWPGPGLQ